MKMKKILFGSAILILIVLTASLGLLTATFRYDDISEQEYQISLKKAVGIFKKETNKTKVQMVQFVPKEDVQQQTNNTFQYLFVDSEQMLVVNPTTGKPAVRSSKLAENQPFFDIKKIYSSKSPQKAMKEAVKQSGKRNAKVRSWVLLMKSDKLYYEIKLAEDNEESVLLIRA